MIKTTSYIPAPAQTVWEHAIDPAGFNQELMPFLRMTVPRKLRGIGIDDITLGERIGRSWILFLGVIPVDYDDVVIAEIEPGRRFLETSSMLSMRKWKHERIVSAWGEGCSLTDRVSFELRPTPALIPGSKRVATALVRAVFAHRHRRLFDRFSKG